MVQLGQAYDVVYEGEKTAMNIGERIKQRRKQINMSAEALAEKLKMNPSTIYRYENGDIDKVDAEKLMYIADALRITPGWLMGWEEQPYDLNFEERRVLNAYRAADPTFKEIVLELLESHPAKEKADLA